MEIGHLHILVNDTAVSKAFYVENFGMTLIADADFGVLLHDDAGTDFVIGPVGNGETQGQRMHFGFRQNSKLEVKEKYEELKARGCKFKTHYVEFDFITLFSLPDPDGNLVEVYFAVGMDS